MLLLKFRFGSIKKIDLKFALDGRGGWKKNKIKLKKNILNELELSLLKKNIFLTLLTNSFFFKF